LRIAEGCMEERAHVAQREGCLMEAAAIVEPMPLELWATCPNCGSMLDAWKTCPQVSAEVAAVASTSRRPRYCSGKDDSDAATA
jgi:hypothetical protein